MSDVILRAAEPSARTRVSNVFIDHYMSEANGEYVKVYLYLLRCLGDDRMPFSIGGMADALDHTQRDISRALAYWEKQGLLRLELGEDGVLSGICVVEPKPPVEKEEAVELPFFKAAAVEAPAPDKVVSIETARRGAFKGERRVFSPEDIAVLGQNEEVREMLCVTERYMGRPLSSIESDTVLYWYDGMGLSVDLIVYLVEYCLERGHGSIHYMNKVASGWASKGITTVEEAKTAAAAFDSKSSVVAVEFGITDRGLTPAEQGFLDKWQGEYGFSKELIAEACKRTILKAGRASFPYADTILQSWRAAGAFSIEAVSRLDEERRLSAKPLKTKANASAKRNDRFHNFNEHGYDYSAIEGLLIQQQ